MSHTARNEGCALACKGYIYWLLWKSETGRGVGGEKPTLWERMRVYRLRKWVSKCENIFTGDWEAKFWKSQESKPKLSKTEVVVGCEILDLFLSHLFDLNQKPFIKTQPSPTAAIWRKLPTRVLQPFILLTIPWVFYLSAIIEPYSFHLCITQDNIELGRIPN